MVFGRNASLCRGEKSLISVVVQRASDELWTYAPWPGALGTAAWLVAAIPPWCRGTPSFVYVADCDCGAVGWFKTCNRTRTGIAALSPRKSARSIEGMKSARAVDLASGKESITLSLWFEKNIE